MNSGKVLRSGTLTGRGIHVSEHIEVRMYKFVVLHFLQKTMILLCSHCDCKLTAALGFFTCDGVQLEDTPAAATYE